MLELKYIGRNHDSSYIANRKHASYYLLPDGIRVLKQLDDPKKYNPRTLRNARNAERLSESFIEQRLTFFSVRNRLKKQWGESLRFFTENQLVNYPHFPQSNGYVRLTTESGETQFFVDVLSEHPFFLATRKVNQYLRYAEEEASTWKEKTNSDLPHVLLICENASLQKRLLKKMKKAIEDGNMRLYATNMEDLRRANPSWQNMANPEEKFSLIDIM
jgi:hypothetical protein